MYFQVRVKCSCGSPGLWAYLKVHTLGNGDVIVGLGPRRVEKPEDSVLCLDSPKSHENVYVKKTLIERSVLVIRKPVGSSIACLEAVSSYSKTTKRLKDPLRLQKFPCGHSWPYSRLKTYVALAEMIAFDLLQCSELKLYDAANVSLTGPLDQLYPLSILRIAHTGMSTYGSYGYTPMDLDPRTCLLLFRKVRVKYQSLEKKPTTTEEWDRLLCDALDMTDAEKARKLFQMWLKKTVRDKRIIDVPFWERRDLYHDQVPLWLQEYQDRWKDVY